MEGGKLKVEGGKLQNEERTVFFFFLLLTSFENPRNLFWATKMGIFYREKALYAGEKIRKKDFAPTEKYSSYAPGQKPDEPPLKIIGTFCLRFVLCVWRAKI